MRYWLSFFPILLLSLLIPAKILCELETENIKPDRFEYNSSSSYATILNYPADQIGESWLIENLTLHYTEIEGTDVDFYKLILPSLNGSAYEYNEDLIITVEPEAGYNEFEVSVRDCSKSGVVGEMIPQMESSITIEDPRSLCPDGVVLFSVKNHSEEIGRYRMHIEYNKEKLEERTAVARSD